MISRRHGDSRCYWPRHLMFFTTHLHISSSKDWIFNGHEFEQALRDGEGQGSLVCCTPWGRKESDTPERLNWASHLLQAVILTEGRTLVGPSQGDTQASPQQKKGPTLSVVKSSNRRPPYRPMPQTDCCCSAPPTPAFPHPVIQRGGQGPPHTRPLPASPPWTARGWVGVRCTFWRQSLAACTSSCHLEHSFWNFPYVSPVIFSLSRGSHQSLNRRGSAGE